MTPDNQETASNSMLDEKIGSSMLDVASEEQREQMLQEARNTIEDDRRNADYGGPKFVNPFIEHMKS